MGPLAVGHVVLVQFPFSDLTESKLRPAVVLADAGRGDWILCQITSNPYGDPRALAIVDADLVSGALHRASFARPGKLFTAHASIVAHPIGELVAEKFSAIREAVVKIIQSA